MPETALADVVVLELAGGVAGPYAGRLLADLGAQVVKVEPPGGDPCRGEPPLVGGESAFFNWLNAGKLGASMALDDSRIAQLAAHADVIIHSERGAAADALDAMLAKANPGAAVLSLTPYGRTGERSGWEASEITEMATSGFTYIAGDPAREPVSLPGHQAEFHAGLHAGFAALAGLWHALETGEGQRVELSHQEATLSDHSWVTSTWTHQGGIQKRTGSIYARCADGFIYLFNLVPYPNLFVLMERFDLLEDESLLVPQTWWARFPEILVAFTEWAATRTKQEIYHAGQELRIAMSPVNDMADVAANPQLAAREWFRTVEAGGQILQAPGFPYRLMGTPCSGSAVAPKPGQHTAEVCSETFAWANSGRAPRAAGAAADSGAASGPLHGIRLIEVTANWAGPIGGRHFADLGADVIKIELATKPATRALVWVADDMWPKHYHRSGYFNKLNRNKRAICLDLAKAEGKEVFKRLVATADAIIENNAARVMTNLGLGYETLSKVNPGLVMCSMSGYGATGPDRNYSAYGSNIETSSGLASVLGYGPDEFYGTGSFYADPVTGNHGAVAVMAGLLARRRSHEGQWIDMSLLEAVTPFFAQPFLEYRVTGKVPVPLGNRSAVFAPQGLYQSAGTDCWLALTVREEREWQALCGVIGRPELASDPGLASVAGRRKRHDEIDAAIGEWAIAFDHIAASNMLQAAGIAAAPVMPNWEIVSDNHLNKRDFFVRVSHPEAGTHWWPGWPWRFEKTPGRVSRAAPMFAEHNQAVFGDLLGMPAGEVGALYATGVTSDEPIFATGPGL
ncbi:MAG: CaiB/BaiF CoA transferase family protein [Dehalococcoidia bacterium]